MNFDDAAAKRETVPGRGEKARVTRCLTDAAIDTPFLALLRISELAIALESAHALHTGAWKTAPEAAIGSATSAITIA